MNTLKVKHQAENDLKQFIIPEFILKEGTAVDEQQKLEFLLDQLDIWLVEYQKISTIRNLDKAGRAAFRHVMLHIEVISAEILRRELTHQEWISGN